MTETPKLKVSKSEFAKTLYYCLKQPLNKYLWEVAKDFKANIESDYDEIPQELFALNLWMIVRACEKVFEDKDSRNDCLDIFHQVVYKKHAKTTEIDFPKWMKSIATKYIEYNEAIETEHPSGSMWVLSKLVNKNLFGQIEEDPIIQLKIGHYIDISFEYLEKIIRKYDVG